MDSSMVKRGATGVFSVHLPFGLGREGSQVRQGCRLRNEDSTSRKAETVFCRLLSASRFLRPETSVCLVMGVQGNAGTSGR
jgi:hypothetical protein